jgi:hypothetical protein
MPKPRNPADEMDEIEALVESCLPLIFETYDAATKERLREPVVLLIDCEDAMGREMAEAWLGKEAVEDSVLAVQAEQGDAVDEHGNAADYTTVFARAVPLAACRQEVPVVFPYLAGAFDALPPDAVLIMAVSAGGAATFVVPHASRP